MYVCEINTYIGIGKSAHMYIKNIQTRTVTELRTWSTKYNSLT